MLLSGYIINKYKARPSDFGTVIPDLLKKSAVILEPAAQNTITNLGTAYWLYKHIQNICISPDDIREAQAWFAAMAMLSLIPGVQIAIFFIAWFLLSIAGIFRLINFIDTQAENWKYKYLYPFIDWLFQNNFSDK